MMNKLRITIITFLIVITLIILPVSHATDQAQLIFTTEDAITREYIYDPLVGYRLIDEDLTIENICQTIYVVIQEAISPDSGEYIKSVSIKDGVITVVVFLPKENAEPLTVGMYAQGRVSN